MFIDIVTQHGGPMMVNLRFVDTIHPDANGTTVICFHDAGESVVRTDESFESLKERIRRIGWYGN